MTSAQIAPTVEGGEFRAERDQILAMMFPADNQLWLVDEEYDPLGPFWTVIIVRRDQQGRWFRQRYRFDALVNIMHFMGTEPLSDAEARSARQGGKLLQ